MNREYQLSTVKGIKGAQSNLFHLIHAMPCNMMMFCLPLPMPLSHLVMHL